MSSNLNTSKHNAHMGMCTLTNYKGLERTGKQSCVTGSLCFTLTVLSSIGCEMNCINGLVVSAEITVLHGIPLHHIKQYVY